MYTAISKYQKVHQLHVIYLKIFLLLLFSLVGVTTAHASQSNVVATDNVKAQLVSERSHVEAGKSFSVLLKIDIRDGWHTYWRNPGDSGQATSIKWQLPKGVTASAIEWPYPERQYVGPVANYGYHGVALHRIKLTVDDGWSVNKPIDIAAKATWLVCEEECIPEKGRFEMQVSVAQDAQNVVKHAELFDRFEALLPLPLAIQSGYQYAANDLVKFEFAATEQLINVKKIEYFPYEWGVIQPAAMQMVVLNDSFVSITTIKGDLGFIEPLIGVLVVTDKGGNHQAYQVQSKHGTVNALALNDDKSYIVSLLGALLFAVIGGLILNLMPCVFPVLSMKALSLVSHADQSELVIRRHGLVYTLGILVSFLLLGIALLLVKSAGNQIGWGFQLQSPLFVAGIVVVLFALGLSLSGFLEIGASFMGLGSGLANQSGYKGSFFTGVLAVIVATPCTAPFMGPAVGFALTQSPVITLAVLIMLGFGLALPYLLLCYFPALSSRLPKPGAWMRKLQQLLAFPMYATAAWLVWVFGLQAGMNSVFALLLVCILMALAMWLWQSTYDVSKIWQILGRSIAVIIVVIAVVMMIKVVNESPQSHDSVTNKGSVNYEKFTPARLSQLQSEGSPVFVNMTAAWCITCLANERVALSTTELKTYFKSNGIAYLKGDWTNQDATITSYLESFGRSSVPLYVYYPANKSKAPIVLPQILTVASVVDLLESTEQ